MTNWTTRKEKRKLNLSYTDSWHKRRKWMKRATAFHFCRLSKSLSTRTKSISLHLTHTLTLLESCFFTDLPPLKYSYRGKKRTSGYHEMNCVRRGDSLKGSKDRHSIAWQGKQSLFFCSFCFACNKEVYSAIVSTSSSLCIHSYACVFIIENES